MQSCDSICRQRPTETISMQKVVNPSQAGNHLSLAALTLRPGFRPGGVHPDLDKSLIVVALQTQKNRVFAKFEKSIVPLQVEGSLDESETGTGSSWRDWVDFEILRETISGIFCVYEGGVGLVVGVAGARAIIGGEIDEFQDVGVAETDAFGEQLMVECLLVGVVEHQRLLLDELMRQFVPDEVGRDVLPVPGEAVLLRATRPHDLYDYIYPLFETANSIQSAALLLVCRSNSLLRRYLYVILNHWLLRQRHPALLRLGGTRLLWLQGTRGLGGGDLGIRSACSEPADAHLLHLALGNPDAEVLDGLVDLVTGFGADLLGAVGILFC
jgi:hypothetical protein